jgi:ketosteroid isomerase-like protein
MPGRPPRLPLPPAVEFDDDEREVVLAANRAFYRAFNDRDFEAMDTLWAPTGPSVCLHPGHPPLYERSEIMESWRAIMSHPNSPRVRCTDEWATGRTGLAVVVCREILPEAQLMATNTFVRQGEGWKMIGHHSGPVPNATSNRRTEPAAAPARDRRKLH